MFIAVHPTTDRITAGHGLNIRYRICLGGSMKILLLCEHHAQRRPFLTSRSNLVRLSLVLSHALRSGCRVTRAFGSSREIPFVPAGATNKMIGTDTGTCAGDYTGTVMYSLPYEWPCPSCFKQVANTSSPVFAHTNTQPSTLGPAAWQIHSSLYREFVCQNNQKAFTLS